jgi:hypothetical protein
LRFNQRYKIMKKTLIALAVMASGAAFAQVSATSTVNGFTQSMSAASGNQSSSVASDTTSANYSGATANFVNGIWSASAGTTAQTSGFTHAAALSTGTGPGAALSIVNQSGQATGGPVTGTAAGSGPGTGGLVNSFSNAQVGTQSTAAVGGPFGTANGTSFAVANNATGANINAPLPGTTAAVGVTFGNVVLNMAAPSTGSGAATSFGTLAGGVGAVQTGIYGGTITRP